MLRRRTNISKKWYHQVTIRFNDGNEIEAEIEVPNRSMFYVHYPNSSPSLATHTFFTIDCALLPNEQVDLVQFFLRGDTIIKLRFPSPEAKEAFLEGVFRDRKDDSGNNTSLGVI
ncbi:hypothetical protein QE152_g4241 [Popillia japonica]|uniref:Uncharacterized protein n=1 Tax=Popillia japonica TaxID=7064 RepID=A0AAW1N149_POPJA